MRINDKINVIRRQAASSETFGHIGISCEGLPGFDVLLNRVCIARYISPNSQIKQYPSCAICMAVPVLDKEGKGRHRLPCRLRRWMDKEALRKSQVTSLQGMYLDSLLLPLLRRCRRSLLPREDSRHVLQETLQSARDGHDTTVLQPTYVKEVIG